MRKRTEEEGEALPRDKKPFVVWRKEKGKGEGRGGGGSICAVAPNTSERRVATPPPPSVILYPSSSFSSPLCLSSPSS